MPGALVTPEAEAAAVGREVLTAGGSAIDAAVSASFAQAVVNPLLCGLGGSALVLHADLDTGIVTTINGEAAMGSLEVPQQWTEEFIGRAETFGRYSIASEDNQVGAGSIMVPGFVDAMEQLLRLHSTSFSLPDLLAGATGLARNGFTVSPYAAQYWRLGAAGDSNATSPGYPSLREKMNREPNTARLYLRDGVEGYRAGETFAQPWIADILDRLAQVGLQDFLHGQIGSAFASRVKSDGSLIDHPDVSGYRAISEPAITTTLGEYTLYSTAPPSPGLQVLQMLRVSEELGFTAEAMDAASIDLIAKIMRASFSDNKYIKATLPEEARAHASKILDHASLKSWANKIRSGGEIRVTGRAPGDGTTHVTAVDDHSAVCITHSLGSAAGSAYVVPELGFIVNNFLGHYDPRPGNSDSIRAHARIGTGAPVIALDRKQGLRLALGAPGGSRLITSIYQVARDVLLSKDEADTSVQRLRVHSEEDRKVFVEPPLGEAEREALRDLGNDVTESTFMSRVQAISKSVDDVLHAGSDPRGGVGVARAE